VTRCAFYVAAVGRRQFERVLSGDGPYIDCGNDGVALGTCASIEQLGAEIEFGLRGRPAMPDNLWIAKYLLSHGSRRPHRPVLQVRRMRISVTQFSSASISALRTSRRWEFPPCRRHPAMMRSRYLPCGEHYTGSRNTWLLCHSRYRHVSAHSIWSEQDIIPSFSRAGTGSRADHTTAPVSANVTSP